MRRRFHLGARHDQPALQEIAAGVLVLTREPIRGATSRPAPRKYKMSRFNPCALRTRPWCPQRPHRPNRRFNPRAREGSTGSAQVFFEPARRFQPASPRGLDRGCKSSASSQGRFQPASPRGLDAHLALRLAQSTRFNPRAREGSTVRICIYTHILIIIFILDNQSAP